MERNIEAFNIYTLFNEYPLREYPDPIKIDPKTKKPLDPATNKPLDPKVLMKPKKKKKGEQKFV